MDSRIQLRKRKYNSLPSALQPYNFIFVQTWSESTKSQSVARSNSTDNKRHYVIAKVKSSRAIKDAGKIIER